MGIRVMLVSVRWSIYLCWASCTGMSASRGASAKIVWILPVGLSLLMIFRGWHLCLKVVLAAPLVLLVSRLPLCMVSPSSSGCLPQSSAYQGVALWLISLSSQGVLKLSILVTGIFPWIFNSVWLYLPYVPVSLAFCLLYIFLFPCL